MNQAEEKQGLKECPFCGHKLNKQVNRNYEFFKKWWALVKYAYDHWEPGELPHHEQMKCQHLKITPEINFDRFRKDLIILAGHYTATFRINGEVRIEAKSVSYKEFPTDESFEPFYSATVDAVLKHILKNYTGEELERCVLEVMSFT